MASRSPSRSEGEVLSSDSEANLKANSSRSSRNDTNRARDDDRARDRPRHDPRTFHVRYEDDRPSRRSNGTRNRRASNRSRSPSRSPPTRSPYRHSRRDSGDGAGTKDAPRSRARDARSPSVDMPGNLSQAGKNRATQQKENDGDTTMSTSHAKHSLTDASARDDDCESQPVLDEAAIIEERRKRREAIKNKYRGQGTPLLVQALHSGPDTAAVESAASSPGQSDHQFSTTGANSSTARDLSPFADLPQSSGLPADFASSKAEDWPNGADVASPAEDGPSAADYDPTIDMQEERARHDKRLFKENDAVLPDRPGPDEEPAQQPQQPETAPAQTKDEFDMFAEEEDDDDMFAEAPAVKPKADLKAPQALDAGMMDNWDDPEGYYITILGELIDNRYQVTQNLGRGMFSSVVRATDSHSSQVVAIKIVRSNESMRKAGLKEIDILRDLAANDPEDRKHVIRLLRSFEHKGHLCMVFENLSMNLREVLKKFGRDVGINLKAIRAYAQQLFLGLGLLKRCQYLHADLKPDNILVNEARNLVKICDLGSASPISENATAPYLVSRFYRAPEVILGIPYDYGIDMWSIGCTLFELYTGKILFTGRNNNSMLKAIMDCRGKFPHKLLRRGTLTYDHFDDLLNFKAEEADKVTGRIVTKLIDIKAKPVRDLRSRLLPRDKRVDEAERREVDLFLDLLDKCLDLRPEKRITPNEALKHPFILRTKQ
ncbi:hypothetical protein DV735_g5597, partial [Chaetothyriales sp. CBS 134920]